MIQIHPSDADKYLGGGCRGMPAAAERAPKRGERGESAKEGVRLHGIVHEALLAIGDIDIDPCDAYAVGVCLDAVGGGGGLSSEAKHSRDGIPGKVDAYRIEGDHLTIYDFKFGRDPVDVVGNAQLRVYLWILSGVFGVSTATLVIVQPLVSHGSPSVSEWRLDAAAISESNREVREVFTEIQSGATGLRSGAHCRYCPALAGCPAAREVSLIAADYAMIEIADGVEIDLANEIDRMREAKKITSWRLTALEEQAMAMIDNGTPADGCYYKIGRRGALAWRDSTTAVETVNLACGVDIAKPIVPITPTQAIAAGVSERLVDAMSARNKPSRALMTDGAGHGKEIERLENEQK